MKYGPDDVFYVEVRDYGHWGCVAFEAHTSTKVEADSKEEALAQMKKILTEWDLSRPDPDAPELSVEKITISRPGW